MPQLADCFLNNKKIGENKAMGTSEHLTTVDG